MQYFALQTNGELFALGDHGDLPAAELTALDLDLNVVCIASSRAVQQWKACIENNPNVENDYEYDE